MKILLIIVALSASAYAQDSTFYAVRGRKIDSIRRVTIGATEDRVYEKFQSDSQKIDHSYGFYLTLHTILHLIAYYEDDPIGFALHNGEQEFRKNLDYQYEDYEVQPSGPFAERVQQAKEYVAYLRVLVRPGIKKMEWLKECYAEKVRSQKR